MYLRRAVTGLVPALAVAVPVALSVPVTGWAQMDEIVVSTRRREESIQDVPIAVTAIGAEQIERQNINSLEDIVKLAPSVQFDNSFGPADTRITIRGLSNTRGRSNVAFLIDGIDVTTENLISAGSGLLANRRLLNDVERIELVKGPQSALYGRAAFSGALSYITKEPGPEPGGKIGLDLGEDGQQQLDFSYETPVKGLEDVLGIRASGVWWDEDGRYTNSISGNDVGGTDGFGGALTAVFTPSDAIKIKTRVEYSDEDYEPRPQVRLGGGLPEELIANEDGSQDNTWPWQIIPPGAPGNETGTQPIRITQDDFDTKGNPVPDGLPDVDPNDYTCRDQGNVFRLYPKSALDADFGVGTTFANTATGLADFGPGFCLPDTFGTASGQTITQSEDPFTGKDYDGTSQDTFRGSIVASYDADFGTFSSYSGWTNFNALDAYDQDNQAVSRPDTLLAGQQARTRTDTDQFSQEIRFQSNLDGSVQFTVGGLYWEEDRKLRDQNFIILCAPVQKIGGKYGTPRSGPFEAEICNGQNGTVASWQEYARLLPLSSFNSASGFDEPYFNATTWEAETESWSVYGMLEWELAEQWKLTFETRYVEEEFSLLKPAKSSCTNTGFSAGFNLAPLENEDNLAANPAANDIVCESERVLNPDIFEPPVAAGGSDWRYNQGSESSSFSTPKITLEFTPTDDALLYFFYAQAQKPGGINQLAAGGFAESVAEARFDSEKLKAWELGLKSSWEVVGFLQLNASGFFQDYTDKQLSTQVVINDTSTPRVLNAAGAEVWGLELETTWQPSFAEGLTMSAAWTWLDAEYTEFNFQSASVLRSAQIGSCNVTTVAEGTPAEFTTCSYDFSGNKLERTPDNAVVLQGNYTRQFGASGFDWFLDINASWQDERFVDENNSAKFKDYWLADARLGLSGETWELIGYCDNLFDDDTIRTGGTGPDFGNQVVETGFLAGFGATNFFGTLPDPRTFGIRASFRFGDGS
jgi:outer membrane receptor protein involved in Fe transport